MNEEFMREVGIWDLPEDKRRELAEGIEKQVMNRVSLKLGETLSDAQMDGLVAVSETEDEGQILAWLKQHVPNYGEIVAGVLNEVKSELKAVNAA